MAEQLLTTEDNPFNPHTHWDEWYAWDVAAGYDTCGLLARVTITSDELSEADNDLAIETAMNEIISEKIFPIYKKV